MTRLLPALLSLLTASCGGSSAPDAPTPPADAPRAAPPAADRSALPTWLSALEDPDDAVADAAAWSLSQQWAWPARAADRESDRAASEAALLAALARRGPRPRLVYALSEVGSAATVPALWEAARAGSTDAVLARAVLAKRGVGPELGADDVPTIAAWLGSSDPDVVFAASYLVGRASVADAARPALRAALTDALASSDAQGGPRLTGPSRRWVVRALAANHDPGAPPPDALVAAASAGPTVDRVVALDAFPVAHGALAAALADPDPQVAAAGARALARVGSLDAVRAWRPTGPLRAAWLDALAGTDGAVEIARPLVTDPDPDVRAAAYRALLPSPDDVRAALAREADPRALLPLATALAEVEGDAYDDVLAAWLVGPDPWLGAVAAEAVDDVALLSRAYTAARAATDPDEWERRHALAKVLCARDVDAERILADPNPLVARACWEALPETSVAPPPPGPAPDAPREAVPAGTVAVVVTTRGELAFDLFPDVAPGHVASFVSLARSGFYDGVVFHRVVPDFVVQAGDPTGTGWGGPGYTLRDEFSDRPYVRGTLGMARSDHHTAGSQFFVTTAPHPHLRGHYTVFGQLRGDGPALDNLRQGDVVVTVRIEAPSGMPSPSD